MKIIGETIKYFRLVKEDNLDQEFADGTGRRQISVQDFVVALLEGKELKPSITSSAILLEDETSDKQVEAILKKVCMLSKYLSTIISAKNVQYLFAFFEVG